MTETADESIRRSLVERPKETRISAWGDREELREIARRVQLMAPGGRKLQENEALALAQGAVAHGLDPFNGEIWFIPGSGLMAGIKGLRKAARGQIRGNFWTEFEQITNPDLRVALMIPEGALAFRCIIRDSETIRAYSEAWKDLSANGVPVEMIPQVIGQRPYIEGIGYLRAEERTKMDPTQVAMKRAEADALKRRFDLPFAVATEPNGNFIDADFVEASAPAASEPAITIPPTEWADAVDEEDMAWMVEKRIIPPDSHPNHVVSLLKLSPFKPGEDFKTERGLRWFKLYRGTRDQNDKTTPVQAAAIATDRWKGEGSSLLSR